MERVTLSQTRDRWQRLLDRQIKVQSLTFGSGMKGNVETKDGDNEEDPFECESITIPPLPTIVDHVLEDFAQQWQQLDMRRIHTTTGNTTARITNDEGITSSQAIQGDDETALAPPPKKKRRRRQIEPQHHNHIRLPENFDFATRQSEPPPDDTNGHRIVSLLDPTQSLSYERALWELFREVPTLHEIELSQMQGMILPHLARLVEEMKNKTEVPFRMRRNNRHAMPPFMTATAANVSASNNHNKRTNPITTSTVRLEFWRRHLGKNLTDPDRAIFEFCASQTLAEVHHTLVEMAQDDLGTATITTTAGKDDGDATPVTTTSGYFFIEDTFYTIGEVDYVGNIQTWLNAGSATATNKNARKTHLGISSSQQLKIRSMEDTQLKDISWRLGFRYNHCHHGDVECAMFVTDLRHFVAPPNSKFPWIHDIWTSAHPTLECEACQKFPVAVATTTSCQLTQGHRGLCMGCSQQLFGKVATSNTTTTILQNTTAPQEDVSGEGKSPDASSKQAPPQEGVGDASKTNAMVLSYPIWRNQARLSLGADQPKNGVF